MDFGATSDTATLDAERYLKEVAPHLAALPAEERTDLLEDLAQHLREIAAEPGPPLNERLGPPEVYAAELLASAGVITEGRASPPLLSRASTVIEAVRASWVGKEAARTWPFLRPTWWVLRAWLAVSLLSAGEGFPVPMLGGYPLLGFVAVLAAVPLSVRLGQQSLPRSGRLAVLAGNVVLVIYALSLTGLGSSDVGYIDSSGFGVTRPDPGCLATASGEHITNLYAYDADGRLLDPVLLYNQNGQPIDNLCPEFDERGRPLTTDYRQDVNGAPVINAFPRRQSAVVPPARVLPSDSGLQPPPGATVPVKPPPVVVPRLTPAPSTTVTSTTVTTTAAPPTG